jgi:iron-sulfur cluster repair protein YtfE (RIC family)
MAAKKTKKSASKKAPSAPTALLKKQHREVEKIFAALEKGKGDSRQLLKDLSDNLAAHMAIEQDIYYPAVKKVDEDLINESYEEHSLAELGLKRLLATNATDEAFEARVTAVKELIEHHVEEEEEDLFPKVDKKLDKDLLAQLGAQMKARFEEVKAAGFAAAVPKGFDKTSADISK